MLVTVLVTFLLTLGSMLVMRPVVGQLRLFGEVLEERGGFPPATLALPPGDERPKEQLFRRRLPTAAAWGLVPAGLLLLGLGLAGALYATHPRRRLRRFGGRPLTPEEAPRLFAFLADLVHRSGLRSGFTLCCKPGGFSFDGQSFGFKGRETLALAMDPRLLGGEVSDPVKAISLHELAHLTNRDAQDRERGLAVWTVLWTSCLLLVALALPGRPRLSVAVPAIGGLLFFLLLTHLLWRGVVRARELYADWRVVAWGHGDALRALLGLGDGAKRDAGSSQGRWSPRGWLDGIRRLGRVHPSRRERLDEIESPRRLFEVSPQLAFVTGALLALLTFYGATGLLGFFFPVYYAMVRLLETPRLLGGLGFVLLPAALLALALLAVAHLLTRTLGSQVQRAAIAGLAAANDRTWGYLSLLRVAAFFGVGFEAGALLTPLLNPAMASRRTWLLVFVWELLFAAAIWLWMVFLHAGSRLLLATHSGPRPPRGLRRALTATGTVLLSLTFWPATLSRLAILSADAFAAPPPAMLQGMNPAPRGVGADFALGTGCALILLLMLWGGAFLLLAALRRRDRNRACPHCGRPHPHLSVVGRFCVACSRPLAPWAYSDRPA